MSTLQQTSAFPLIQPVILADGSRTRLWPLPRAGFPKHFLCLTGEESLFQMAARRRAWLRADDIAVASPLIVTEDKRSFLALELLAETGIVSSHKTNGVVLEIKSILGETLDHSTWCL
jgi:mannose-1-phosphate guanylyltransferase